MLLKLDKNERTFYQLDSNSFLIENGFECYIDIFVLTNKNIRIICQKKKSEHDKEFAEIVLPLCSIKKCSYKFLKDKYELNIKADKNYQFYLFKRDLNYCLNEILELIQQINERK